jgi:glycosyltransferase involved in cell wall biosynthesis
MNYNIIIPVYNNSQSIKVLFTEIEFYFNNFNKNFEHQLELIFVDDGSLDFSIKEIETLKSTKDIKITLIALKSNYGQLYATVAGLKNSSGDKLIILSADLQDDPKYLKIFFEKLLSGSELVIGIRKKTNENLLRKLTSWIHYSLIRIDMENYPKGGFDFYGFDRNILENFLSIDNHFMSQTDLIKLVKHYDYFFYEKKKRTHGSSQYNFFSRFELSISQIITSTRWPSRFTMLFGILMFSTALISIIILIIDFLFNARPLIGWRSILSIVIFFFGIILIILGLIIEYLYRIFIILRKPNIFLIKFKKNL